MAHIVGRLAYRRKAGGSFTPLMPKLTAFMDGYLCKGVLDRRADKGSALDPETSPGEAGRLSLEGLDRRLAGKERFGSRSTTDE